LPFETRGSSPFFLRVPGRPRVITASSSVRKRTYPLLRVRNLTRASVCPALTSKRNGKASAAFCLFATSAAPDASPTLAGTAQLAYQQASLAGNNIKAYLEGREMKTKHFEELGEALSLGTERAAVLTGGKAFGGALARQARFALYTSRLPTWHHRLRVGASWFFEGTTPRPLLPLGLER